MGLAPPIDLQLQPINMLSINIRYLQSKFGEICYRLECCDVHALVCQETWLDQSVATFIIPNSHCIARRDRSVDANRTMCLSFLHSHTSYAYLYDSGSFHRMVLLRSSNRLGC